MPETDQETTYDKKWPPPWARQVGFFFGLGLFAWEAVIDNSQNLIVYAFAYAFTGLPIARGVEKLAELTSQTLSSMSGSKTDDSASK